MAEELKQLKLFSDVTAMLAPAKSLYEAGCCPCCLLRFLGEKDSQIYQKSAEELQAVALTLCSQPQGDVADGPTDSKCVNTDDIPCIACLGILQHGCSEEFLEKIQKKINEEGYKSQLFSLSLMTPIQLIVREHAVMLFLRQRFSDLYTGQSIEKVTSMKDVYKWRCGPRLKDKLNMEYHHQIESPFLIQLMFEHKETETECSFLISACPKVFPSNSSRKRKRDSEQGVLNRTSVARAISSLSESKFMSLVRCPPEKVDTMCRCEEITCYHEAVFVAGRYNKYSRTLSQTPWVVDGERRGKTSVSELICTRIQAMFMAQEYRFSSAGREDVDVRTLGRGRPFLVELIQPHVSDVPIDKMKLLQQEINSGTTDIAVRDLQVVSREESGKLKVGETEKTKSYSALVRVEKTIQPDDLKFLEEIKDLKLAQKTPIRVIHRRPLASRDRVIHNMSGEYIDSHHFTLHLKTQAGTYIKEFVHGDFGRTQPSLSTLMHMDTDILELDVESVDVDWPKTIDE
ncbi:PREDICTED: putative tRNA pseudouridine synthase Pus10 [Branchiostoma belcheri]|uniref:tRNA pseudouridine(55) synthase n=1 Tax=Branchiostoma belcheri TaxID=7741 RepID=A0A6P5A066_BRABE|nr:PREDICTED: putative tRNA pseudouridine synthase Pus10 [Branchiostoma belcheri]